MSNRTKWRAFSEDELMRMLKNEIERIDCQENPGRALVQSLYDNENMPNPTYYEQHFVLSWPELMATLGFTVTNLPTTANRKQKSKWSEYTNEDLLRLLKDELKNLDLPGYPSTNKFEAQYDKSKIPPPIVYLKRFGKPWRAILESLDTGYDSKVSHHPNRWQYKSEKELLDLLKAELVRTGILDDPSLIRYQKVYNNACTPSSSFYVKHFDCGWADVLLKIGIRYGKYNRLKQKK